MNENTDFSKGPNVLVIYKGKSYSCKNHCWSFGNIFTQEELNEMEQCEEGYDVIQSIVEHAISSTLTV